MAHISNPATLGTVRIVLPAYNEAAGIRRQIETVAAAQARGPRPFEIIVVDDGSTDDTAHIVEMAAKDFPVHLVRHDGNQGLGMAIQTGLTTALERSASDDTIFTMDADNSHPAALMLPMDQRLSEGLDVVIGSRFRPGARTIGVPFNRVLFSIGASWFLRILFPTIGIRDYTCGYRAYRASKLRELQADGGLDLGHRRGFECMVYILLRLRRLNTLFGEVPMVLRYDLKEGASKMRVWRTIRDTLKMIAQMRFGK